MDASSFNGWVDVLLALVLITGAFMVTRKDLLALVSAYSTQSALLAALSIVLYLEHKNIELLYLAALTLVSKTITIPYFIRKIQKKIGIRRDLEFRYLGSIGSMFVTVGLTILAYFSLSRALVDEAGYYLGAILGVSLALMGMMVVFSRKKVITKIVGFLAMENGVLLFGMFVTEIPLIVEVMVVIDLIILVLLSVVLAVGIDSSLDDFQRRISSVKGWFSLEKEDDES